MRRPCGQRAGRPLSARMLYGEFRQCIGVLYTERSGKHNAHVLYQGACGAFSPYDCFSDSGTLIQAVGERGPSTT